MANIAIDLTPLLPSGENGGAKIFTLELIKQMAKIATGHQFILITLPINNNEIAELESHNIKRVCLTNKPRKTYFLKASLIITKTIGKKILSPLNHTAIYKKLKHIHWKIKNIYLQSKLSPKKNPLLKSIDLIYCPFTAPNFKIKNVPIVSTLYDLQHIHYPEFFSAKERTTREQTFKNVCLEADKIICISEYVRQDVINQSKLSDKYIKTIYINLPNRLPDTCIKKVDFNCLLYKLEKDNFFIYPANFWPHKNHEMLLAAFRIYKNKYPTSNSKLVLTGFACNKMNYLINATEKMNLKDDVIFTGYITNDSLSALLTACKAMIFPSLYEGFGMPILEAMAKGKPVLCSNVTCLPEITQNNAELFDPRKPYEIVNAMEKIIQDNKNYNNLAAAGLNHAKTFADTEKMATQYLEIFDQTINNKQNNPEKITLSGIYQDNWMGKHIDLFIPKKHLPCKLTLEFFVPENIPQDKIKLKIYNYKKKYILQEQYVIKKGDRLKLEFNMSHSNIRINATPNFQPITHGISEDNRTLSCMIKKCCIKSTKDNIELFTRNWN